jgi:hypothetical protein
VKKELLKIEDTKGVIRSCKLKNRQYNGQQKRTKRQTIIYKALLRKLKIDPHDPHKKNQQQHNRTYSERPPYRTSGKKMLAKTKHKKLWKFY